MQGFETFGGQHLLWLMILAVTGAAVLFLEPSGGRVFAAVLAAMGRVVPGACAVMAGSYGLDSLPLHVCSMAGYGCFLHFLMTAPGRTGEGTGRTGGGAGTTGGGTGRTGERKGRTEKETGSGSAPVPVRILSELLYFPGLIGALMALLFPGWGHLPAFSLISCCEFLGHFGIVLYVLCGIRSGVTAPHDIRIPVLFCILYALVMLPFDLVTGMNYGFLLIPAPDSPLSAIAARAGGGAGYYAGYAGLVLLLMGLFYVPFRGKQAAHGHPQDRDERR